jgi:hypothetical protein
MRWSMALFGNLQSAVYIEPQIWGIVGLLSLKKGGVNFVLNTRGD